MAQITITIPDQYVNRVIHALCYNSVGASLEETPANAKAQLVEHIKSRVREVEFEEAKKTIQPPDVSDIAS